MFDFRLKVFHTVAKRLNFTKAAEELFITQPAVTKHIKELENHFKVKLFDRNGSKIQLTAAGTTLLQYVEQIFSIYNNMEIELGAFTQNKTGNLRIGASTTAAQYILPPILASFHSKFKDVHIQLITGNSEHIETSLQNGEIDLGIIEGKSQNTHFQFTPFLKDELVLVARRGHALFQKPHLKLPDLLQCSFILREPGSGTLDVIAFALKKAGINIADLPTEMRLDSSETIKSYLFHSDAVAFLSVYAILKELNNNECAILDVKGLEIDRTFNFIQTQGKSDYLPDFFIQFALKYNFK